MKEIVAATKNKGKIREIEAAFAALPVKILAITDFDEVIPEVEETGLTFAENAIIKARHSAYYTKKPCIADDSGLEVDALGGAPGVYSARYAGEGAGDEDNNRKLLAELAGVPAAQRTARFRCVLAFVDDDGKVITADGTCEGLVLEEARGSGGFGYDPLFYYPPLERTLAEIGIEEKNQISHRGRALRSLAAKLTEVLK